MARMTLLVVLLVLLVGCATPPPPVRTVFIERPQVKLERPLLPVEALHSDATAIEVFRAYEESLLICVGHVRALEALQ